MKWTKPLYNCNCGLRLQGLSIVNKCDWCTNAFWTMSNSFRATFCHYSNWTNQVIKTFDSGNQDGRNWRQFKCPKDTYAQRVAVRLGRQQQTDIGFVGMQIQCSTSDLSSKYKIQDNYKHPLTDLSFNSDGTFVSGLQIKYQKQGRLLDINLSFQRMAVISNIQVRYKSTQVPKSTTRLIQTVYLSNSKKDMVQNTLTFTKTSQYKNTWNNFLPYLSKYKLMNQTVGLKSPRLNQTTDNNTNFIQTTQIFLLDKQLITKFTPYSNQIVIIQLKTVINASAVIQQYKTSQFYQMTLTFSDQLSGEIITTKNITGVWSGTMISSIKTIIQQITIDSITNPSIYYAMMPSGQKDQDLYKWSNNLGGYIGSTNSTVDIPPGYWLVGASGRTGGLVDQITFEYTSNQKDLITRGPYGGNGGGPFSWRAVDYKNGQWVTKINIFYDNNYVNGIQFTTNKMRVSPVFGQQKNSKVTWDNRWFKRFTLYHSPYLSNIMSENI